MKFDIIIAHRNENNYRERNLKEILKYYLDIIDPDTRIIIVEQNTDTEISIDDSRIVHIKEKYDTEYFWKAKLLNRGVRESVKEAFCVVDSDAVLSKEAIDYLYSINVENFNMIFPYTEARLMNEGQTRLWIKERKMPVEVDQSIQKSHICYTGFFMAMSRRNYNAIGGYDEEYIGWGGEDDAVVVKTKRINDISRMPIQSIVLHMYHPRKDNPEYTSSARYEMNELFTHALKTMSNDDLHTYCSGKIDLKSIVVKMGITRDNLYATITLKSGANTKIPIRGVYPLPNKNGEFDIPTMFKGLYVLLGKEEFVRNTIQLVTASRDTEERNEFKRMIDDTIEYFETHDS